MISGFVIGKSVALTSDCMGDLQPWSSQRDGVLNEEGSYLSSLSSPSSSFNPNPMSISEEHWIKSEQTTNEIICRIQPTVVSEQRRKDVIDYIQRLLRNFLGSEVFPFGSVPLKTYLPDGDIDLTAFSIPSAEDALSNDVRGVLEGEEQNEAAVFEVKDVQYIHAEVLYFEPAKRLLFFENRDRISLYH
ncbi:uncharacterized protein LOC122082281 [Macadamia integrifolia]|uniref:uncharacterized protein LOC122082281 n=1 Tax=Macadamia integrifolia TaxID=60698 RepID=UPI001C4EA192|nr:uncharacterized protein LOC122082281 [Macadamia integrifolia]